MGNSTNYIQKKCCYTQTVSKEKLFVTVGCNTDDMPKLQGGIAFDERKEECPECKKIRAKTFKETCTDTLTDIVLIRQLVDVLYYVGCLSNFVCLVKYIANGTMSSLNIAFLLCLDSKISQLCNIY